MLLLCICRVGVAGTNEWRKGYIDMDLAKPTTQLPQALLAPMAVSAFTSPDSGGFENVGFSDVLRERMSLREHHSMGRMENYPGRREPDRSVSASASHCEHRQQADASVAVEPRVQAEARIPKAVDPDDTGSKTVDAEAADTEPAHAEGAGSEAVDDGQPVASEGESPIYDKLLRDKLPGDKAALAEESVVEVSVPDGVLVMAELVATPDQDDVSIPVAENKTADVVVDDALLSGDIVIPVWIEQSFAVSQSASGEPVGELMGGGDTADMGHLLAVMGKNLLRSAMQGENAAVAVAQQADTPEGPALTPGVQQAAFMSALVASVQKSAVLAPDIPALQGGTTDDGLTLLEGVSTVGGITAKGAMLPLVAPAQPMTAQQSVIQAGLIAEKLAAQIVWMQSQHVQRAEINLRPEELGQLQIRLDIQRDQASVNVSSPHAHVREWLDAGQSRLRDLLGQTGVELASYSVSDGLSQQSDQQQRRQPQDGSGAVASGLLSVDEMEMDEEGASPLRMGVGLVDSYA